MAATDANAADAGGDLAARVTVGEERDEVDALASAFNGMTARLGTQRQDDPLSWIRSQALG